jgi:hypothetical protein
LAAGEPEFRVSDGVLTMQVDSIMQVTHAIGELEREAMLGGYPEVLGATALPYRGGWRVALKVRSSDETEGRE